MGRAELELVWWRGCGCRRGRVAERAVQVGTRHRSASSPSPRPPACATRPSPRSSSFKLKLELKLRLGTHGALGRRGGGTGSNAVESEPYRCRGRRSESGGRVMDQGKPRRRRTPLCEQHSSPAPLASTHHITIDQPSILLRLKKKPSSTLSPQVQAPALLRKTPQPLTSPRQNRDEMQEPRMYQHEAMEAARAQ